MLDANVLIALVDPDHVHHGSAIDWFASTDEAFATCPITQGALVRHLFRRGHAAGDIGPALERIQRLPRHEFWPDDQNFVSSVVQGLTGHRQVIDAYLCHLARSRHGRIATFDRAMMAAHPDVVELVDVT